MAQGTDIPADFGALVGWDHQDLGDRVMVRLQSTQTPGLEAGKQLDESVVESLASVLAGRGTDYRHADAADYDQELDMLRRVDEAARG